MTTSSENPQSAEGRQYHIGLAPGEVAPSVMLVGDPERAVRVSKRFDDIRLERRSREYVTLTGTHDGLPITVMGTGMGPANTEIAVIELSQCFSEEEVGSLTLVRCGSTGGLQEGMQLGDLVISLGGHRLEATSTQFVDPGYPAVAHPEAVLALVRAASESGLRHHVGITATAPGFYGAQGRDVPGFPPRDPAVVDRLARQGVTNLEMEASTLFTLASLRRLRAGAVCAVYATRRAGEFISGEAKAQAEANCIEVGLAALHHLAQMATERGDQPMWHPGLTKS
jgi:uridine phosphorylase